MSDEVDVANDLAYAYANSGVAKAASEAAKPIPTSPVCLECGEGTAGGARWCSASCRDYHEMRNR